MKSFSKKPLSPALIWITVILVVVSGTYLFSTYYFRNYALDIAKPFDKTLLAQGATKKCERTGNGFSGIDDKHPGYGAYYETSLTRDESITFINKIADNNGFKLKHAVSGDLPIPDMYIDNYYYDHSSKINQFSRLKNGTTELDVELINSGGLELSNLGCGTKGVVKVYNDASHTAIRLNIKLPEVR